MNENGSSAYWWLFPKNGTPFGPGGWLRIVVYRIVAGLRIRPTVSDLVVWIVFRLHFPSLSRELLLIAFVDGAQFLVVDLDGSGDRSAPPPE